MNTDEIIIKQFIEGHGQEAARVLEKMEPENLAGFFNDASTGLGLAVIPWMKPRIMSSIFEKMDRTKVVQLFESLQRHHAVWVFRSLNTAFAALILTELSPELSSVLTRMVEYLENSVGAYMDSSVFTIAEHWTVKEALVEIRSQKNKVPPDLFVLTSSMQLAGVISLSDLITRSPEKDIRTLLKTSVVTLSPDTPVESILKHEAWNSTYALPVVDRTSLFLGTISLERVRSLVLQPGSRAEELSQATVSALGELYRIGLEGLLRSATDLKSGTREKA